MGDRVTLNYSILDGESDLTIGYCRKIVGLNGKIYEEEDHLYHKIECKQFVFCDEFKEYVVKKKESMNRLVYICIVDTDKNPIGRYPFFIFDKTYYHKIGFPEEFMDIDFYGSLDHEFANDKEIEIWNKWRISPPVQINEWASLDLSERRVWLKVVKNYYLTKFSTNYKLNKQSDSETNDKDHFVLDGTNVTDYPSFFCAMGEAINGPGGYYGSDINSMADCLFGGFGSPGPFFTLTWKNYDVAKKHLDKSAWRKQVNYIRRLDNKLLYKPEFAFEEWVDTPLIEALVELLEEKGVTIVFD
ncbi:barstar family protein [Brevibacillus porteri]|uniref:barstar family protein n=1 Tax=Brevibacillus porteri TaxID=2126350 RepID=UPI003709E1A2